MPIPHLPLLASVSASPAVESLPSSTDPITFQTALLVIIAGALLFLAKNLAAVNQRLVELESDDRLPPERGQGTPASLMRPATSTARSLPLDTVAAIAAAVSTTLGTNHRILEITAINGDRQVWSMEGRRQVFQSHMLR